MIAINLTVGLNTGFSLTESRPNNNNLLCSIYLGRYALNTFFFKGITADTDLGYWNAHSTYVCTK